MSDLSEAKSFIQAIHGERERLAKNQQVPIDELQELVLIAYACSRISEGKAIQLLCIDRVDFRDLWLEWGKSNQRMLDIYNSVPHLSDDC